MLEENKSLVLFSGGQDSTLCLMWALSKYEEVFTIGFNYNQTHKIELQCRENILKKIESNFPKFENKLKGDFVINLDEINKITESSLLGNKSFKIENGLPNTFIPGRNLLFINYAAIFAYQNKIKNIIGGMCQTDYSGYPDCRSETIESQEETINKGMEQNFKILTPLMNLNKEETWSLAFNDFGLEAIKIIIEDTHTCYKGDRKNKQVWGYGCNDCPACELRSKGWNAFIKNNPIIQDKLDVLS